MPNIKKSFLIIVNLCFIYKRNGVTFWILLNILNPFHFKFFIFKRRDFHIWLFYTFLASDSFSAFRKRI
jgi:hypothetical protein